jgi:hypothetical protein
MYTAVTTLQGTSDVAAAAEQRQRCHIRLINIPIQSDNLWKWFKVALGKIARDGDLGGVENFAPEYWRVISCTHGMRVLANLDGARVCHTVYHVAIDDAPFALELLQYSARYNQQWHRAVCISSCR